MTDKERLAHAGLSAFGSSGIIVRYPTTPTAPPMTAPSIFLIGPMGAGKSSVGRALARRIGYAFVDSDREIVDRCGVDIPTIFEYEGEAGFRDRETRMLDELTALPATVVATGGGAVLRECNRALLSSRGHVILLSVDLREQLRRVALDTNRPLLQTDNPKERLRTMMAERAPIYHAVADYDVRTDSRRMHHVVTRILRHLRESDLIDSPSDSPSEAPVESPSDAPVETPAESPAELLAESPSPSPTKPPVDPA